ncbi:MAG: hypothetical protein JWR69_4684 [Pedosphaera sp.]|nr:hypothetical protein [Pedosphaera sp.]
MKKVFGLILTLAAVPLLLGLTGCATGGHYGQSAGERVDERGTSARVQAALAEDTRYKYPSVSVETFTGTVELSGVVDSQDQQSRAVELAGQVPDVKAVVNYLTVKTSVN